jgi:GNAT superfamily N-acetyltransferase
MIQTLTPDQAEAHLGELSALLIDAVESGASIGFMLPIAREEADAYWRDAFGAMSAGSRILLAVVDGDRIDGAVQLALETRANGLHRAEAIKLFVHRRARRRGLAKALMAELATIARSMGRTLLVMDTRKGGEAERMCQSLGYIRVGEVPGYALSTTGDLHTTVFYYADLTAE